MKMLFRMMGSIVEKAKPTRVTLSNDFTAEDIKEMSIYFKDTKDVPSI